MPISKEMLKSDAQKFGLELDETALGRFDEYADILIEWNEKMNLTAITDPQEIVTRHFIDSLTLLDAIDIPEKAKIIDVGTGAGFPSVPLLIARPDLKITMLDSTGKKLNFLFTVLEQLGLSAEMAHMRGEEAGRNSDYREKFDYAAARAVADLRTLCEYCIPLVKIGGYFAAMKGPDVEMELREAGNAINILGGELESVKNLVLPDGSGRNIVLIKKISQTSPKYPRVSAQISKRPL